MARVRSDLTDTQIIRLKRVWGDRSISVETIASTFGLNQHSLAKVAGDLGLPPRTKPSFEWTDEADALAVKMLKAGATGRAIVAKLDPSGLLTAGSFWGRHELKGWPRSGGRKPPKPVPVSGAAPRAPSKYPTTASSRILAEAGRGCLWPVGDEPVGGDMSRQLFCCEPAVEGRYCQTHADIAHGRGVATQGETL